MSDNERERFSKAIEFVMSRVRPAPRSYAARGESGLKPIGALLERLGNPHHSLRCLHIAGSKGKGSVAIYAEAILREAGLRTGLFTSPHLEDWTERVRVAGVNVAHATLARAIESAEPHVRALDAEDVDAAPGFFDVLTAAAFIVFRDERVDAVVLETGLGGRLDATNIVVPAATCITSIELEHTDKLGQTLAEIAGEKAGIIKPRVPLVSGVLPAEAATVIGQRAAAVGSRHLRFAHELEFEIVSRGEDALEFEIAALAFRLRVKLPSPVETHARNAALALSLVSASELCSTDAFGRGARVLERTTLPGRIEFVTRRPWLVIDGAHTVASVRALAETLDRLPAGERRAIVSVSRDRDAPALLAPVLEHTSMIVAVAPDPHRSMPVSALAARLEHAYPAASVITESGMREAIARARDRLPENGLVFVAGSIYAAGAARRALGT